MTEHEMLVGLAGVFVLGIAAQWVAWRLQLPSILLLLLAGILAGPVAGIVKPDEIFGNVLVPVVSLSVSLILFEGSLGLKIAELRKVAGAVRGLISVGAAVTWAAASGLSYVLFGLGGALSILLGAILIVSGPTVVGPILRHVRPQGPAGLILKWESILIDPIGATLAVLIYQAMIAGGAGQAAASIAVGLPKTVLSGTIAGGAGAALLLVLLKRYWVPDFLHNPLSVITVITVFVASNLLQDESGFLAVTVMGFILANQKWVNVEHIVEFKETLRVLLLSMLFVLLSARLEPGELRRTAAASLTLMGAFILVIRPAAVALSTRKSQLTWRDKAFLACVAPRGVVAAGVASVFALRLSAAGYADAEAIVSATFVVIMGTAAIYGTAAMPVARWLGLARPHPKGLLMIGAHQWARALASKLEAEGFPAALVDTDPINVYAARVMGLRAYQQSVLAESVTDEIDLAGIGKLLALTSNDELNTLVAQRFAGIFGRSEVYVLSSKEDAGGESAGKSRRVGRVLFAKDAGYEKIAKDYQGGAEFQVFRLTEDFDQAAWQEKMAASATPLFLICGGEDIAPYTAGGNIGGQAGDAIVALVRPAAEPK